MSIREKKLEKEDIAWILDYLPYGCPGDSRPAYQKKPIAQGIGEKYFVLVEMVPKEGMVPQIQDRVYIGEGERDIIDHVKRRLEYEELTHGAQLELENTLEKIIKHENNEPRFTNFFNTANPITNRKHMLELLPGIGKRLMWAILEERKKGDFVSLKDIEKRVKGIHAPEKTIAHRIIDELKNKNIKYRIFTKPISSKFPISSKL
ncbi:MAG TPA: DUF655 domain-containing protein [Methanosarcinales archaeon]|nr:DUF655 domain-containing protein [Methanosarcinales archaeon]